MLTVFLASICATYEREREQFVDRIKTLARVIHSESGFPVAEGQHSHDVCLDAIRPADALVLVLTARYGQAYAGKRKAYRRDQLSISHAEFREARRHRLPVIVLVERAVQNADPGVDPAALRFLEEVTAQRQDNWISVFDSPTRACDTLVSRLNQLHNLRLGASADPTMKERFTRSDARVDTNGFDLLASATWTLVVDDFATVRKEWSVRVKNLRGDRGVTLHQPLVYPVFYDDVCLEAAAVYLGDVPDCRVSLEGSVGIGLREVRDYHAKASLCVTMPGGLEIPPGGTFGFRVVVRHRDYFTRVGGDWLAKGRLCFLDYAGFAGVRHLQRICKQLWIKRSTVMNLRIDASVAPDWNDSDEHYWKLGWGREFTSMAGTDMHVRICA